MCTGVTTLLSGWVFETVFHRIISEEVIKAFGKLETGENADFGEATINHFSFTQGN